MCRSRATFMWTFYGYLFCLFTKSLSGIFSSAILFRFFSQHMAFPVSAFPSLQAHFPQVHSLLDFLRELSLSPLSREASSCLMYTNSRLWNYNKKRQTQKRLPNSGRAFRSVNVQSWNEKAANIFDRLSCGVLSVCEQFLQNIKKACRTLSETIYRKKKTKQALDEINSFMFVLLILWGLWQLLLDGGTAKLFRGTLSELWIVADRTQSI